MKLGRGGEGGGVLSYFFGSEILAKSIFFWVYERCQDFLDPEKKQRDFFGILKSSDFFG